MSAQKSETNAWQSSNNRLRQKRKKKSADFDIGSRFREAQLLLDDCNLTSLVGAQLRQVLTAIAAQQSEPAASLLGSSVCLGLGSPSDSRDSRLQLALWLGVVREVAASAAALADAAADDKISSPILVASDPVFTNEDRQLLLSQGIVVADSTADLSYDNLPKPCLAYLPHAPNFLLNNVLYQNWTRSGLTGLVLLGNSLASLKTNLAGPVLRKLAYIEAAVEICSESGNGTFVNRGDDFFTAFNDLSLQWFPRPDANWLNDIRSKIGEPYYSDADERLRDLLGLSSQSTD